MGKRSIDLAAATLGLLVFSPLLVVIAVAILVSSRGPVIFSQERLGRGGRMFRLYKFRSMVANADRKGALVTAGGDRRITLVGRCLRRCKLDELPQLFNVLKGDMSLVGPRPEVAEFANLYPEAYSRILTVRPGITHRGTLAFRCEEAILGGVADPRRFYIDRVMPHKLALYEQHLDDSLLRDIHTIVETILPWKLGPAVSAADLFDAPIVANIPAWPDLPARGRRVGIEFASADRRVAAANAREDFVAHDAEELPRAAQQSS